MPIEINLLILRMVEADIAKEHLVKLIVEDTILPDTSALVEGLLNETCGVGF